MLPILYMYMVNKKFYFLSKKAGIPRFFYLQLLLILNISGFAQKSSKYLVHKKQNDAVLYFMKPVDFNSKNSHLTVDFTLYYHTDSLNNVTVNYSLFSKKSLQNTQNMCFFKKTSTDSICVQKTMLLFVEKHKKKWEYRYTSYIPLHDFLLVLNSASDMTIVLENNNQKTEYTPSSSFIKGSSVISEIISVETQLMK